MWRTFLTAFLLALAAGIGFAQTPQPPAREHHGHGYVYVGPGAFTSDSETLLHYGVGGEGLIKGGLGAGIEIGGFANPSEFRGGFGVLSPDLSYHFLNATRSRKLVPFVTGGYTLFFASGVENGVNYGGGINYWFKDRIGMRIEVRDHVFITYPDYHLLGVRFGLTFR